MYPNFNLPKNLLFPYQRNYFDYIKILEAWKMLSDVSVSKTFGDPSIIIAVIDTGVESKIVNGRHISTHPSLDGNTTDGNYKIVKFFDFSPFTEGITEINTDKKEDRQPSHGVAVTTVLGAMADIGSISNTSFEGIVGVAPNCRIISAKTAFATNNGPRQVAELLWCIKFDAIKKFKELKNVSDNFLTTQPDLAADIISISYDMGVTEEVGKVLGDILTTFGRNGLGSIAFFAAGNNSDVVDLQQEPLSYSEKLIGITSSKISNGVESREINDSANSIHIAGGAFSSPLNKGVDFCVPDLIVNSVPEPLYVLSGSLKGNAKIDGKSYLSVELPIVSNNDNRFLLKITSIDSTKKIISVQNLPNKINALPASGDFNYSGLTVLLGSLSDFTNDKRKDYAPEYGSISSVDFSGKKITLSAALTKSDYETLEVIGINGNPYVKTYLNSDFDGTSNTLDVINNAGFSSGVTIQVGLPGNPSYSQPAISTVSGTTTINLSPGSFNKAAKGEVVRYQRVTTTGTSLTEIEVNDANGLQYSSLVIIGEVKQMWNSASDTITTNPELCVLRVSSVDLSTKKLIPDSATPIPAAIVGKSLPISGHREVMGYESPDVILISDVAGLIPGMGVFIGLPTDENARPATIISIDYNSNKLQFNPPYDISGIAAPIPLIIGETNVQDFSGTSFSTPVAAGIAALMLSAQPQLNWVELKYLMRKNAERIDSGASGDGVWKKTRATTETFFDSNQPDSYSRWYGYGRIDAEKSVENAKNYTLSCRDLKIRDFNSDDGSPHTTNVDSPDIWNRIKKPSVEGNAALPGDSTNYASFFNVSDKDQPVASNDDSYLYVRINNASGFTPTTEKNLDAWVRLYVAITDQSPSAGLFKFPEYWYGTDDLNAQAFQTGTYVQFIDEIKISEYELESGALADNNITIKNIKWPKGKKPNKKNTLDVYLLALITPFDGGITDGLVQNNNNLTYKKIKFQSISYNDASGNKFMQEVIPVDISGLNETLSFNIDLKNTDTSLTNNTEIKATINYLSGSDETVIFKFDGSNWNFTSPPTGAWLTLNDPVPSGVVVNGFEERVRFSGIISVNNTVKSIDFETTQYDSSSTSVLTENILVNIVPNFPIAPDGIATEKKTAIYTFTDFDQLPAQSSISSSKLFGPVSTAPTTQYRTMSAFTGIASGTQLKAYAVTSGEFFIQEVPSSNVVTLVLKPDAQPDNQIAPVKYFVYRGIKKSSFLQTSGDVLPNGSGLSDVLTRMWEVRTILDTESSIPDVIGRNDLGLDDVGTSTPTPGGTLIEEFFETYVFQKLAAGWHIGDFETSGDYGFEIIVEGPNYKPTLDDLRVTDSKVTITYTGSQPVFSAGQEEDIKTKLDRERILSYVDPAAYFGLLSRGKIELKKSSGNVTIENDPAMVQTEILSKFGDGITVKIYVDIRNELNNSLNFYGSYSNTSLATGMATLMFKDTSGTFVPKEYHTSGWPILTLDSSELISGSTDFIEVSFQLPQGDNVYPALFLSGASLFSDGLNYQEKFKLLNTSSSFTDVFSLSIGNLSSTPSVLPYLISLSYTRRYDIANLQPIPSVLKRPWKDDYMDSIFTVNEIKINPPSNDVSFSNSVKWNTKNDLQYIGWTSMRGFDFTLRRGEVRDSIGTTYFAFIDGVLEKDGASDKSAIHSHLPIQISTKTHTSFFLSLYQEFQLIRPNSFSIVNPNINTIQVNSVSSVHSKDILEKSFDDVISISISSADEPTISALLTNFLNNSISYIIVYDHELRNDDNDVAFFSCKIGVQGIEYNNSSYNYEVKRYNTNIELYSLDGRHYFSIDYGNQLNTQLTTLLTPPV